VHAGGPQVALAALPLILAHVAISLLVLSPRQRQTVPPDSDAVVLAQRTLGGVDATTFTVRLDGKRLGGALSIRVGERITVPLRGLATGPHRLEIDYRPDVDEPGRSATVEFEVGGATGSSRLLVRVAGAAGLVLLAGGLPLVRRGRRARRGVPARP
jgi:hypothetical protein